MDTTELHAHSGGAGHCIETVLTARGTFVFQSTAAPLDLKCDIRRSGSKKALNRGRCSGGLSKTDLDA